MSRQEHYSLRPLRLKDHRSMVELGLLARPYRKARDEIATWLHMESVSLCYAVEADGAFCGAVCCFLEPRAKFSARAELYLNEQAALDIPAWVQMLLEEVFAHPNLHRLELLLPLDMKNARPALIDLGFEEDTKLRDVLPMGRAWQDAVLYSILREEQGSCHYAFIPLDSSVIAIYGDERKVKSINFLTYGSEIAPSRLFDSAYASGIVNHEAKVVKNQEAVDSMREPAALTKGEQRLPKAVELAAKQIREYLVGGRQQFDFVVESRLGTAFQEQIWAILRKIPYGETRSYMEVALAYTENNYAHESEKERNLRAHNLSRAVGMACGQNPLCLFTPCHRVVGQNRKLTGFSGGIKTKAYLLDLELINISGEYHVPATDLYKR